MGYCFGHVPILLEGCARGMFHRGDTRVQVLLQEDLCNPSPGFCALVVREETLSPYLLVDRQTACQSLPDNTVS